MDAETAREQYRPPSLTIFRARVGRASQRPACANRPQGSLPRRAARGPTSHGRNDAWNEVAMEAGAPSPLQLAQAAAVGACALASLVSFLAVLYVTLLIGVRTGAMIDRPEERGLNRGERAGRKNSRAGRFFVADEFRPLRR